MTRSFANTIPYDGPAPEYAHKGDAGFDLRARIGENLMIKPRQRVLVPTGIKLELPLGTVGMVCSRSGLAHKLGLVVSNAPGVVDSSYRGEVFVSLMNLGTAAVTVLPNDRIAQLLIQPVLTPATGIDFVQIDHPDQLSPTLRGEGGFGSTGVQ